MAETITNELIYDVVKKIQNSHADMRHDMADIRRDIRGLKDEIVFLRTIMGEFIKTDARRETDYLHLASRVDRIEHQLDLRDHPP